MRVVFCKLERDCPSLMLVHKALALERRSHSISVVEYGHFHTVKGGARLEKSVALDIYTPVDEDWLKELLKGQEWPGCEFISIITTNDEEIIPMVGWSISAGETND